MRIRIKSKTSKERARKPSYWVTMGTLAACTVTGPGAALAQQTVPGTSEKPAPEQHLPIVKFSIGAGLLQDALLEFERASGWKVQVPEPALRTLQTKGVSGVLPVAQALRQLLSGTGLAYSVTGSSEATLRLE